jgi:hypothetical protein
MSLNRRKFLRAAGVSLALPLLDRLLPTGRAAPAATRRRMMAIHYDLSLYGPSFFPKEEGRDYTLSPYLELIRDFRNDFTVFSGLSHPAVDGGHSAEQSFLTAAPHPGSPTFRNTISFDQIVAERLAGQKRFDTLPLNNQGWRSLSFSRNGSMLPAFSSPSDVFKRLFLTGSPKEVQAQVAQLQKGRSILDAVEDQARALEKTLGGSDRDKLDEYATAVRECEQKLQNARAWIDRPKPVVNVPPPQDIADRRDIVGRARLIYDLAHLALASDSTSVITYVVSEYGEVPTNIQGVDTGYHALSHHGQDPKRLEQLSLIEMEFMRAFKDFLGKLRTTREEGETLLDRTMVLVGSSMGSASSHDNHNLPILLAGGGFKHGQHVAFDAKKNSPLCNVFVSMLQQMGLELEKFGSSTGTMTPLEARRS